MGRKRVKEERRRCTAGSKNEVRCFDGRRGAEEEIEEVERGEGERRVYAQYKFFRHPREKECER